MKENLFLDSILNKITLFNDVMFVQDLVSALLSPEPALSHHNLAPGLLTLGPMSPLSPVTPALSSPQNRLVQCKYNLGLETYYSSWIKWKLYRIQF